MSYHHHFDRLGNPLYRPPKPARQPMGHRIIQTASVVCLLVLLAMLYGGRP